MSSTRRAFVGGLAAAAAALPLARVGAAVPRAGVPPAVPRPPAPFATVAPAATPAPAAPRARQDERPRVGVRTRFACNVEMWFRHLPFLERLPAAAALGFDAIELWPWQGKDLPAIAELCAQHGLEVAQFTGWGFTPALNDPAHHAQFLEVLEQGCEAAHVVGARMLTILAGNERPEVSREALHGHLADALRLAAPIAERHGVVLILEPLNVRVDHAGYCVVTSDEAVRICRAVGSPHVKINWDLYHLQISEGDLCGHLREGFDQLGYVQLADHPGRHEPGTGEIRYARVLEELWALGYRGMVGTECVPIDGEALAARRLTEADAW